MGKAMSMSEWALFSDVWDEVADLPAAERSARIELRCRQHDDVARQLREHLAVQDDLSAAVAGRPARDHVDLSGRVFGSFVLQARIDGGGQGVVYRALREGLGTQAAVKVLLDPARRGRFLIEKRAHSSLSHPGIAAFYADGEGEGGYRYYALEFLEGLPLHDHCAAYGSDLRARLSLFSALCEAVQYVHSRGIVHCDIKPDNMIIERPGEAYPDGVPRLIDFGMAVFLSDPGKDRSAAEVRASGHTTGYAPPEQQRGQPVAVTHDVFALGVVLYELLSLRSPWLGPEEDGVDHAVIPERVERGVFPPLRAAMAQTGAVRVLGPVSASEAADLEAVVHRAMAADPAKRYGSVSALLDDLRRFERNEPLAARIDAGPLYVGRKLAYRHRAGLGVAGMLVLAIAGTTAYHIGELTRARDLATAEAKRATDERMRAERQAERAEAEATRAERSEAFTLQVLQAGEEGDAIRSDMTVQRLLDASLQRAEALRGDPTLQADVLHRIGRSLLALGEAKRALEVLQRARALHGKLAGEDSVAVARDLVAIGEARMTLGEGGEAETVARDALGLAEARAADAPRLLARSAALFAHVLNERARYGDAIETLSRVRAPLQDAGAEDEVLGELDVELSAAHYYSGRYGLAEQANRRILERARLNYGADHPAYADTLTEMAAVQTDRGKHAEAERLNAEAHAIKSAYLGEAHPETANTLTQWARALTNLKRYDEAKEKAIRSLAIHRAHYPDVHPRIASTMHDLFTIARMQDDVATARDYAERVLRIESALHPGTHPRVGHAHDRMGAQLLDEQDYAGAERHFREALRMYEATLPPEHMSLPIAHAKIGRVLLKDGRLAEAEPETQLAFDYFAGQEEPNVGWLRPITRDLVAIHEGLGHAAEVERLRPELQRLEALERQE